MDIAAGTSIVGKHTDGRWSDEFRNAPSSAQKLSLGLEFFLPSLVLIHSFAASKLDIAG